VIALVKAAEAEIRMRLSHDQQVQVDATVGISVPPEKIHLFDAHNGERR
jgi:ABC-type sugar transport system ATPase subunit